MSALSLLIEPPAVQPSLPARVVRPLDAPRKVTGRLAAAARDAEIRERKRAASSRWYHANKDQANAATKSWRLRHPKRRRLSQKAWNLTHEGRKAELLRAWRANNKDRVREAQRRYRAKKRAQKAAKAAA